MRENKAMGLILPSGDRPRMGALMDRRTVGAVPFGGRYRLIDFTLSNLVHAGIWDVGVITRNKYESLMDHLGNGRDWDLARKDGGLTLLPPFVSSHGSDAYLGEMQSLLDYRRYIAGQKAKYVILAHADLVGRIDIGAMIDQHIETGADMTVAYQTVTDQNALGENAVAFGFDEKEQVTDVTIGAPWSGPCCRYLGYLILSKDSLLRIINIMASHNRFTISRDLLLGGYSQMKMLGYRVDGYCKKVHDLQSYYQISMELLSPDIRRAVFPADAPVMTRVRDEVPARYAMDGRVKNSLVADGCIIEGEVENCILFRGVKVGKGVKLKNSIIMQNTIIEPEVSLSYVIADRRCYIKEGRILTGFESYPVVIARDSVV